MQQILFSYKNFLQVHDGTYIEVVGSDVLSESVLTQLVIGEFVLLVALFLHQLLNGIVEVLEIFIEFLALLKRIFDFLPL